MSESDLIKLSVINGKALTFSSDDYMKIRSEHRIVGKLIGIPVSHPRNLLFNGLPAFFNDYETKLLMEKGLVMLEDKTELKQAPNDCVKEVYQKHQSDVAAELHKPYIDSRLQQTKVNMELIIKGKIKKLMKSGVQESEINVTPEEVLKDETERIIQSMTSKNIYVQVPTQHPFESASTTAVHTPEVDQRKYKIFRDFHDKGNFITNGDSFGANFLIYPGDPIFYHASQIVHVIDYHQQIDAKLLISCARLSVTVNKKCVFAYVNDEDDVVCQTIQWDNPKLRQLYAVDPDTHPSQD